MSRQVDLATAATLLGLSQAAVKKRLQRGSIAGGKDETGRWYAALDDDPIGDSPTGEISENGNGRDDNSNLYASNGRGDTGIPPASQRDDTRDTTWDDAPLIVVALRETIAMQREQLSVKDEQLRQANVIIAQLTSRPLELAPVTTTMPASPATSEPAADVVEEVETIVSILPANDAPPRPWWRFWR